MRIEKFSFGSITVDGEEYKSDVLLLPPRVVAQWRRLEGHRLEVADLAVVLSYCPGTLVVGSGVSSMMRVPESTIRELESASIRVEIHATPGAVDRFNTLVEEGEKTAAAIHLTC